MQIVASRTMGGCHIRNKCSSTKDQRRNICAYIHMLIVRPCSSHLLRHWSDLLLEVNGLALHHQMVTNQTNIPHAKKVLYLAYAPVDTPATCSPYFPDDSRTLPDQKKYYC